MQRSGAQLAGDQASPQAAAALYREALAEAAGDDALEATIHLRLAALMRFTEGIERGVAHAEHAVRAASRVMLAVARSLPVGEGAPLAWLEASTLAIPLPEAAFDVVLCQQGRQQFPDRTAALREMHRVLVGGGWLAASVWSRIESSPGMAALVAALERHVGMEAANNRRAPFALGDADEVRGLWGAPLGPDHGWCPVTITCCDMAIAVAAANG